MSSAGKTVIAIPNEERIAASVMGGLVFNGSKQENGKVAGVGHLSFDRCRDNQVLALQYKENASGVGARLLVDASDEARLEFLDDAG